MKYQAIFTTLLFWTLSLTGNPAWAEASSQFINLDQPKLVSGQIKGSVASCSNGFDPSGTIVHIPGISISTRLGKQPEFHLLSVPPGEHTLVFEYGDRIITSIPKVDVRAKTLTALGAITLCPDNDGDGFNLMADLDDSNATIHPGAKEICDRKDNNGNGVIDEGCSYRKCSKGGKFCPNNWNNINPTLQGRK